MNRIDDVASPVGADFEALNECQAGNSPPDTGGVDATSRRSREASFNGADGVVKNGTFFRGRILKNFVNYNPVCSAAVASHCFIDGAATPPVSGGEWRARYISTVYDHSAKPKRCLTSVLLLALIFLAACSAKQEEKKEEEHVVTVDVAPVLSSPISLKVTTDALLYPLQQAAIVPKISAPVKKLYVDRGSHVKAGQLLAELENRDLAGTVSENQASFAQAEANYQSVSKGTVPEEGQKAELDARAAKEAMDAQQKLYDSRVGLLKEGAISQKEVNDAQVALVQARTQYDIAAKHLQTLQSVSHEQEVKGAAAQRDAARARTESAQAQLGYSRITSPIDGVVTDRPVYAGEMPPTNGPMITVMDLSQIVARSHISLDDAKQIKVGDKANIFPTDGGAEIPGKVTVVSPALDPSSTTVEVWVQAPNMGNRLTPGTSLRVEMIAKTVPEASVIPWSAVLTSASGSTSVMVVDSENKPHKKSVRLGIRDGANVQVKEGLDNGERVVTVGGYELAKLDEDVFAKTKVKIAPPKEEDDEEDK